MARLPNPNHYNHFGIYLKDVRKALRSDKGHRLLSKTPVHTEGCCPTAKLS